MAEDKPPHYPSHTLTVVIADPGQFYFMQEPIRYRTVQIELTSEQMGQLELGYVGSSGPIEHYENVSMVFFERNNSGE